LDIAPGTRFVVGIADAVPPDADFGRLRLIGDKVAERGELPLTAGGFNPVASSVPASGSGDDVDDLLDGLKAIIQPHVREIGPLCLDLAEWLNRLGRRLQENQPPDCPQPSAEASNITPAPQKRSEPVGVEQIALDVLGGDEQNIVEHIRVLLDDGYSAQSILKEGMLTAMEQIGERFKDGSVFIPEVLLSARAMNRGVEALEPHLAQGDEGGQGVVMIGTVFGDMHDIGKNLVLSMLRGVGFRTIDLGMNVKAETFVTQVRDQRPDVLGLSALLTTTMPEMRSVIESLAEAGLRRQVKIVVGGAPVNENFAHNIGADGYATDAGAAVALVKSLIEKRV
jgi:5-methyltetrahydrofolate--homocysteine methyltransferase